MPGNLGFWFIAEFWIWDEISGVDFWLLIRLHNTGKTIVVKRHLTDEFEKKYEHIGFLGFLKSRTGPDRTETGRFDSVSVFFSKKKTVWLFFIVKNRTENNHPYPDSRRLPPTQKNDSSSITTLKPLHNNIFFFNDLISRFGIKEFTFSIISSLSPMIINFKTRRINRDMYKLTRTLLLKK